MEKYNKKETKWKWTILLPSKGISCETVDRDKDVYLPYVPTVSPTPYSSTGTLDFRKSMVMDGGSYNFLTVSLSFYKQNLSVSHENFALV